MHSFRKIAETHETQSACRVAVIYEDSATRMCAMQAHDYLMRQFSSEIQFTFHWWRADFLIHPETGNLAVADTENADIFIVCTHPDSIISTALKRWLANWSDQHAGHEGALLDMTAVAPGFPIHAWEIKVFLRELAHRATLDYLEVNPSSLPYANVLLASIPQASQANDQKSGDSPSELQPYSDYGLNE